MCATDQKVKVAVFVQQSDYMLSAAIYNDHRHGEWSTYLGFSLVDGWMDGWMEGGMGEEEEAKF